MGYTGNLANTNTLTVTNAAGFRVAMLSSNDATGSLLLNNVSNLTNGGVTNLTATLSANPFGTGTGTYSSNVTVTFGDDSTLSGASNNIGTATLTVTGAIYDHAAGALATDTIALSDVIVGYGSAVTTNVLVTNDSGFRVALGATNDASGDLGLDSAGGVAASSATNLNLILATGALGGGTGTFSSNVAITFYDDSNLAGATTNGTTNLTVTGNIYDHASGSLSTNTLAVGDVIVGYSGSLSNSLSVSNADGFRVNLATTNSSTGALSLDNVTSLGQGSSSLLGVTLANGQGTGTYASNIVVTYADASSLNGASSNLGSDTVTITANIYDHASGTLSTNSIDLGSAIVGFNSAIATNVFVTNAAGFRVNLQTLSTSTNANLSITDVSGLSAGSSSNLGFTLSTNQGVGAFTNNVTVVSADDSTLNGAATNATNTVTVTGAIYDHAAGALATDTIALSDVIVGYGSAVTTNVLVTNDSGFRVALGATNDASGDLGLDSAGGVAASSATNLNLILATGALGGGTGTFSSNVAITFYDDSNLAGATTNGTTNLTVTGNIYDHASGSLSTNTLAVGDVIVGYSGSLSNSLSVSNADGFRVNLATTNSSTGALSLDNVTSLGQGSSSLLGVTLANGQGTGTYASNIVVTYADASSLNGASSNLGSDTVTITANIYDHASGTLSTNSIDLGSAIVGYNNLSNSLSVSNADGFRVALFTTNSASGSLTLGNVTNLAASNAAQIGLIYNGQGTGTYSSNVAVVYGDSTNLAGALSNVSTSMLSVTAAIYGHAVGSLTNSNVVLQSVHMGYTDAQTNLIGISNAAGFYVALKSYLTNSSNNLSLGSASNVVTNSANNAVLTFATNQGVGSFTNVIGVVYGDDSTLAGNLSQVGTNFLTVSGFVYSGQSYWVTNGSGNWTNFGSWDLNGGTPGLDGALSVNDTATFGTNGSGTVTLNTNATLSSLTFSNANASYAITGTGTVTLQTAGLLNNLAGSNTIGTVLDLATNVTLSNNASMALTHAIIDSGSLAVFGTGTTTLSGNNTYSGGTTINGGTLLVNGINSGGAFTVTNAGILGGSGSIVGAVSVNSGGILSAGTNALSITGNLSFNAGTYLWSLLANTNAGSGNFSALLNLNGNLSLTNGSLFSLYFGPGVSVTNSFWTNNQTWTVMNGGNVGAGTNFTTVFAPGSITSGFLASEFTFITNGNALELFYTAPVTTLVTNGTTTNVAVTPNVNNNVVQAGTGTTTLVGSNAASLTIIVNNGTLATTNQTGTLASLVNVTVNGGDFGVQGGGSNIVNNFTVNGGVVSSASNAIVAVTNAFSMNGGTLSEGTYQATNYIFTPSNSATVTATLANLNTNSWALISNSASGASGTTIFNSAMTYTGGTLITNSTLQLGSGSLTGSLVGLVTNNGVFQNGSSGALLLTYLSTNITGTGIIAQAGTGMLTLVSSALNNFTGSFAVSTNGILQLTNNADLGGGTNVYLANSGTFQVGGSVTNLTTPVVVTNGTGIIQNSGTGTLILSGPVSITGAEIIFKGGNGINVTGSISGSDPVIDGGVTSWSAVNTFNAATYIIDGGTLNAAVANALPTVNGRSAVYIDQTNGGTSYGTGSSTLSLGANQSIASLSGASSSLVNLLSHQLTIGTATGSTTYAGVISGTGSLLKDSASTQILTGANTYNGGTTVTNGTLVTVNTSALGSGSVSLGGTGNLELRSLLTVGAFNWTGGQVAIPTLTSLNGVYLNSTNGLTISGGSHVFNLSGASLTIGTPTRLLGATNMSTNSFTINDFSVSGVGNYSLLISNDILWIDLLGSPAPTPTPTNIVYPNFIGYAINQNQTNVAVALNSFEHNPNADQTIVLNSLTALTNNPAGMQQAFNAIMPTFYQQLATVAFNEANAQNMELSQRLWGMRIVEGGGFSMNGFADNFAMLQEGQGDGSGKGVLDAKNDILRPGEDNRWGMFLDGNGIFAQANSGNMLPGYQSESGGVTTGLTYKWNKNVATGIYAGYQGTYNKLGAAGSGLGVGSTLIDNSVRFGLFGTYGQVNSKGEPLGMYVNGLAGGAYHNYQATRIIQYPGMNRTANSSPGAGEFDSMLATGYNLQSGNFTYGPTASLQYTYFGANSVNETGAQSLDFNSTGWNSSSMISSVGAQAAYTWMARKLQGHEIAVIPQVSMNWQHEFMQNPYGISGNLGGTSPTFSNWSSTPLRDTLYTGIGVTVEFAKKWNTSFFYNAAAGNNNLESQNIFWSIGAKF